MLSHSRPFGIHRTILCACIAVAFGATHALAEEPAAKAEVPDEAAQEQKVALVGDIYKRDYEQAQSREQKARFARKLLKVGLETKNDLVGRFILLRIARDIATEQRDLETSMRAIDALDETFQIDAMQMKASALASMLTAARMRSESQALVPGVMAVLDDCISLDRYDIAEPLANLAVTASLKARDSSLREAAAARKDEVDALAKRFGQISESIDILTDNKENPEANLEVGKFYGFAKGDWATALTMLAISADDDLKLLAEQELSQDPNALILGDRWWAISEKFDGRENNQIRQHAAAWYSRALPDLAGLDKARIEQRIRAGGRMENGSPAIAEPKPRFTLALDGETSYVSVKSYRYDGKYPITVEAIVKVDVPPKTTGVICGTYDDAGMGLAILKTGLWEFTFRSRSGGYRHSQSSKTATLGQWTHVAGVYDMSHSYLCVDGQVQPSIHTVPGGHKASRIPLQIGINPGRVPVDFFHGQIRELRVSKVARYNKPFRAPESFDVDDYTLLLLKFDEGTGVVANDASGNDHHGAIVNGTWIPLE